VYKEDCGHKITTQEERPIHHEERDVKWTSKPKNHN